MQTILKKFSSIEESFASVLEATVSQGAGLPEYKQHLLCLPIKCGLSFPQA